MQSTFRLSKFDIQSNVKTPVTLRNYKQGAWVLHTLVIDQSKGEYFYQTTDNGACLARADQLKMYCII